MTLLFLIFVFFWLCSLSMGRGQAERRLKKVEKRLADLERVQVERFEPLQLSQKERVS